MYSISYMKIWSTISLAICFTINSLLRFSFIICLVLFLYRSSSVSLSSSVYFHLKIFMGVRRAGEVIVCCEILFQDQPRWSFYCRFDKFRTFALSLWKFLFSAVSKNLSMYIYLYPYIHDTSLYHYIFLKTNSWRCHKRREKMILQIFIEWDFLNTYIFLEHINQIRCYILLICHFRRISINTKCSSKVQSRRRFFMKSLFV